ncbi:MAG: DsbA family protein [bacterium]
MEQKNSLIIPIAIVVAGALIGGAIYFTGSPSASKTSQVAQVKTVAPISKDDHILGNPNAKVTILEYGDTECPPCKFFHGVMHQVMDNYGKSGDVAWVFRHMPIDGLHPKARKEAEATECANELGGNDMFWNYLNKIYEITPSNNNLATSSLLTIAQGLKLDMTKFTSCLDSGKYAAEVEKDYQDGYIATNYQPATPHVRFIVKGGITSDVKLKLVQLFGNNLDYTGTDTVDIAGALQYDGMKALIDTLLGK